MENRKDGARLKVLWEGRLQGPRGVFRAGAPRTEPEPRLKVGQGEAWGHSVPAEGAPTRRPGGEARRPIGNSKASGTAEV